MIPLVQKKSKKIQYRAIYLWPDKKGTLVLNYKYTFRNLIIYRTFIIKILIVLR